MFGAEAVWFPLPPGLWRRSPPAGPAPAGPALARGGQESLGKAVVRCEGEQRGRGGRGSRHAQAVTCSQPKPTRAAPDAGGSQQPGSSGAEASEAAQPAAALQKHALLPRGPEVRAFPNHAPPPAIPPRRACRSRPSLLSRSRSPF